MKKIIKITGLIPVFMAVIATVFFCHTKEKEADLQSGSSINQEKSPVVSSDSHQLGTVSFEFISTDVESQDDNTSTPDLPHYYGGLSILTFKIFDEINCKNLNAFGEIHVPLYILHHSFKTHLFS